MATPVCPNVRKGFETVGNTMVNLLPVIFPSIGFRDTFRYHLLITFFMASIATVFTLISEGIEQEIITEGA
jgi:hypothetical protein